MHKIVDYIRSIFCRHEYELIDCSQIYEWETPSIQLCLGKEWTYRCKKCGYVKISKNY